MTYQELADIILSWYDTRDFHRLDDKVTIHLAGSDEYLPLDEITYTVGDDILHDDHPILIVQN